jgi:hypothetical protein
MKGTSCAFAFVAMTGTGLGPVFAPAAGFDGIALTNTKAPLQRTSATSKTGRYLRRMGTYLCVRLGEEVCTIVLQFATFGAANEPDARLKFVHITSV